MIRVETVGWEKREETLKLALDVFMQFDASDYSEEGIATFADFIRDKRATDSLAMFGAFDEEKPVGVIATRNGGSHIALFFVDGRMHRHGIGRRLFDEAVKHAAADTITVHSSPYAVQIYKKLGFAVLDRERLEDGIHYTPMAYRR